MVLKESGTTDPKQHLELLSVQMCPTSFHSLQRNTGQASSAILVLAKL